LMLCFAVISSDGAPVTEVVFENVVPEGANPAEWALSNLLENADTADQVVPRNVPEGIDVPQTIQLGNWRRLGNYISRQKEGKEGSEKG